MAISNASNQIVKVNLIPGIIPSVLHLSQYDTGAGRPVTFSVYDGSQAFTIPSGVSIAFEGTKPDGNGFSFTCSKSGSNALLTNYTNQMTALSGKIMCQLVFTDTSGGRVGSLPVLMVVSPAGINEDTVISDSDIEAIVAAQNAYAVLNARLDTAISAATQDSEVQDIRVKADGTSATTAGNAVREQFTELKNDLKNKFDLISEGTKNLNTTGWGHFMTGPSSKDIIEDTTGTRLGMANYVEIEPNTDYAFSFSNSADRNAISIYWTELDSNQDFIVRNSKTSAITISNGWGGGTFTTGENARYVLVWAYKSGFVFDGSNVQLEKGTVPTAYEKPFTAVDNIARKKVDVLYAEAEKTFILPDYWTDYLNTRIPEINVYPVPNVGRFDRFLFLTDVHLRYQNRALKNAGFSNNIAKQLIDRCNIGMLVFGGDAISSRYTSQADVIDALSDFRNHYSNVWEHVYVVDGNHDTGSNGKDETGGAWDTVASPVVYNILAADKQKEYKSVYLAGSYYIDNDACKIRYIFLWHNALNNYTDMPWLSTVLNSTQSGWTIVVFTHYSLSASDTIDAKLTNTGRVIDTLNAYTGDATIACVIGGHIHSVSSAVYTEKGYPVISCYSDLYDVENSGRAKGNTSEQSMQVVQIDTTNKKITLMGIGYADTGTEREYTYA